MKKIILLLLISNYSFANIKLLYSEVKFSAIGRPSFIKANGTVPLILTEMKLEKNTFSGNAIVDLEKLNSGIDLRDKHLKDKYLETKKFPQAKIVIEPQEITYAKEIELKAKLMLHGEEKEVILKSRFMKEDNKLNFISNFEVLLSLFKIELPSFQGISAANKVKLKIDTSFEI